MGLSLAGFLIFLKYDKLFNLLYFLFIRVVNYKGENKMFCLKNRIKLLAIFILSIFLLEGCTTTIPLSGTSDNQAEEKQKEKDIEANKIIQTHNQKMREMRERAEQEIREINEGSEKLKNNIDYFNSDQLTLIMTMLGNRSNGNTKINQSESTKKIIELELASQISNIKRKKTYNKIEIQSASEILAIYNGNYPQHIKDLSFIIANEWLPNEELRHEIVQEKLQKAGYTFKEIQHIANTNNATN